MASHLRHGVHRDRPDGTVPLRHGREQQRRLFARSEPLAAICASDAIARHSRRGWRIDKPNPRAIIALAMAVERAEHKPEPVELRGWL